MKSVEDSGGLGKQILHISCSRAADAAHVMGNFGIASFS